MAISLIWTTFLWLILSLLLVIIFTLTVWVRVYWLKTCFALLSDNQVDHIASDDVWLTAWVHNLISKITTLIQKKFFVWTLAIVFDSSKVVMVQSNGIVFATLVRRVLRHDLKLRYSRLSSFLWEAIGEDLCQIARSRALLRILPLTWGQVLFTWT